MKKRKKINLLDPRIRVNVHLIHDRIGEFLKKEDEFKKVDIKPFKVYPISEPKVRIIEFVIYDRYNREILCRYITDERERKVFIVSGKDILISSSFFAVKMGKMKKFLKYVLRNKLEMMAIKTLNEKVPVKGRFLG